MRRIFLTATLAGALACGTAWAQTGQTAPARKSATAHTAGQNGNNLGMVHLTHKVMANGQPLAAGTYQVRLTDEEPKAATGASPNAERWVEFVRGGKVAGKEV